MHEATVGKSILKIALSKGTGKKISQVRVQIGKAHHLEESSLQSLWKILVQGTLAEGASLIVERPELLFSCHDCEAKSQLMAGEELRCSQFSSASLQLVGGREMEVVSLLEGVEDGNSSSDPDLGRE